MGQTLIVLGGMAAIWAVFALVLALLRRRDLRGEHPGVGEQSDELAKLGKATKSSHRSWKDGQRPWHSTD